MPAMPLPLKGSCRCGQVEIFVSKPPICTAACHCPGCQKMAGSAYSLTAMVLGDGASGNCRRCLEKAVWASFMANAEVAYIGLTC